jgi:hypothetical protein
MRHSEQAISAAQAQQKADTAVEPTSKAPSRALDKRLLRQTVAALQARLGLSHDPTITGEQSQAIALASGIRPEDCVLSSEIVRMREEKG